MNLKGRNRFIFTFLSLIRLPNHRVYKLRGEKANETTDDFTCIIESRIKRFGKLRKAIEGKFKASSVKGEGRTSIECSVISSSSLLQVNGFRFLAFFVRETM